MSLLEGRLPETVTIGAREVRINTDFRASIQFELLVQDTGLKTQDSLFQAVRIYFGDHLRQIPADCGQEAFDRIIWFYRCGRSEEEIRKLSAAGGSKEIPYSFRYDDRYIYAAFRQQYGIDLATVDTMHWWVFRSMFDSLAEDTRIMEIMKYRAVKISSDMTADQKRFYKTMKRIYALPKQRYEKTDLEKELDRILKEGGNPAEVLAKLREEREGINEER